MTFVVYILKTKKRMSENKQPVFITIPTPIKQNKSIARCIPLLKNPPLIEKFLLDVGVNAEEELRHFTIGLLVEGYEIQLIESLLTNLQNYLDITKSIKLTFDLSNIRTTTTCLN